MKFIFSVDINNIHKMIPNEAYIERNCQTNHFLIRPKNSRNSPETSSSLPVDSCANRQFGVFGKDVRRFKKVLR